MQVILNLLSLVLFFKQIQCDACKGCVELDDLTFEKVVNKFNTSIVKFDVAFPYGEKHDAFIAFAKDISLSKDILVAHVGIKDYGDRDNEALAARYNIKKEDCPAVLLFKKDIHKPVIFPNSQDFSSDNIKNFVISNSDVYVGLPGCVEQYDILAQKFIKQRNNRKDVLEEGEASLATRDVKDLPSAKIYILVMKRVLERGDEFIDTETERIKGLLKGKIGEAKHKELSNRLNVLKSFSNAIAKDEL